MLRLEGAEPLLIGIGNPWRRDDGVGPWVAGQLAALGLPAREHSGEGAGLMDAWDGAPWVMVVDATRSGAPPGTLVRIDAAAADPPRTLFHPSSHLFGLAEAVATARVLGRLPPRLILWGIEGEDFSWGDSLSPPVLATAGELVARLAGEMRQK